MRTGSAKHRRADLRRVRQDVLLLLEEREERHVPDATPETTPTLPIETIARQMLDSLGGGQITIQRKGEQTIAERAAELFEEEQRQMHRRW